MAKTDFISKKALLKELRKELRECQTDAVDYGGESILWAEAIEFAIDTVKKAKSIDAVKVVRCKKCEHYNTSCCADGFGWCEKHNRGEMDDDFCSHGERRSDNG